MQLAEFHYSILAYLEQHPYTSGAELKIIFPNERTRIERALILLFDQELIIFTVARNDDIYEEHKEEEASAAHLQSFDPVWRIFLSEAGYVSLEAHRKEMEEFNVLKQELEVAKNSSKSANKYSLIAFLISLFALLHDYFFS